MILFAISLTFFGLSALGGLIDSPNLVLCWYLGLAGFGAILLTSAVAVVVLLFESISKFFQQHSYRLKGHGHHSPHAVN
ncbi:MAG: hypothetical protein KZQ96_21385 [Candidatus Thiodiazotropha sp. (ex Lucinoma borealis)]|nr:hypothetical protein [Candidatus Thiodiazotropha sp. (ex Lucinoma borealis)]MCU7869644.1 hypothetical protein [Candidatus Thiodiazotropha sp. (ex Lucinoma borealis)]